MDRDEAQYKLWQAGRAGITSVLNYLRAVKGGGWSKTAAQSSRPSVRVVMTLIKSETVRTGGAFTCTAAVGGLQLLKKTHEQYEM